MAAAALPRSICVCEQLTNLEMRAIDKQNEAMIQATMQRFFENLNFPSFTTNVMKFVSDDKFSLSEFNRQMHNVLCDDQRDTARNLHHFGTAFFDDNGFGDYARSDVDIIVVSDTLDEAATIVGKVVEQMRRAYGYVQIFETPCSAPQLNSLLTSLILCR